MAAAILIFVHILANEAVEYDIRQNLEREVYSNLKEISIDENGQIQYDDGFVQKNGDIHYLILDGKGSVILGEYPKGCPQDLKPMLKRLQQVSEKGEVFYIRDMRKQAEKSKHKNDRIYLRAIVCKSDAYSRYQTLEYLAYLSILAVSCAAIAGGIMFSRRISSSLKKMCQMAESVGQNMNMSGRMEYQGRFYELTVLAQANNRMLDRLEETFRQQEQFTSDVAHELRTPVAVMTAQCQYARGKTVSREEYQEAFEVIERQSLKAGAIISRLLDLSRLDYDRVEIQKEEIDLPEIVESVCEDLQQKSNDSLKIKLTLAEARTMGDIGLIMIAIQNLAGNAVKYGSEGYAVEIETGVQDGMVFVSVKDYGPGIAKEDMPHIFKRFYKTDKSRNSQGFGLGLPLTMKIAQKHGGTVYAESSPGQGSRFTLLLPVITL